MSGAVELVARSRRRVAAFGVLVAASTLAVIGLSAAPVAVGRGSAAVGMAAVGAVLLGVDVIRRHHGSGLPWRPLLLRLGGVALLLVPLFVHATAQPLREEQRVTEPPRTPALKPGQQSDFSSAVDHTFLILLILLALGLIFWTGILGLVVRRVKLVLTRRELPSPGEAGAPVGPGGLVQAPTRADALRRSALALAADDDARQAVIAAYVALEGRLGEVAPRLPSETAHEFVGRVLREDLNLDHRHVDPLLGIFARARFSAGPVSEADAAQARAHLHSLVGL